MAAVSVFSSGRGRDTYLLKAARAVWFVQAMCNIHVQFFHREGASMVIADALSRYHLAPKYIRIVKNYLSRYPTMERVKIKEKWVQKILKH